MQNSQWWGTQNIPENSTLLFHGNTFVLAVEHKAKEWCVHVKRENVADSEIKEHEFSRLIGEFCPINCGDISRHILGFKTDALEIKPSLADRTVVCRPLSPITIVPGASVVIYLSTPVWLTLGLFGKEFTLLKDVATQRLSDTWFGASTREGELCYASQTNGRLEMDKLPQRIQRVITPLSIENRAENDLVFERVALPVPSLSLYATTAGQLWTQNVSFIRESDGDIAKLKLGQPPAESTLVNGPRVQLEEGQLIRAFSAIFK